MDAKLWCAKMYENNFFKQGAKTNSAPTTGSGAKSGHGSSIPQTLITFYESIMWKAGYRAKLKSVISDNLLNLFGTKTKKLNTCNFSVQQVMITPTVLAVAGAETLRKKTRAEGSAMLLVNSPAGDVWQRANPQVAKVDIAAEGRGPRASPTQSQTCQHRQHPATLVIRRGYRTYRNVFILTCITQVPT